MRAERFARLSGRQVAATALAVAAFFGALSLTRAWHGLELKGYDLLAVANAPNKSQLPITIVGIDEASFQQIGRQWPWPRSLYAKLIDQLMKGGALVVAMDILISEASTDSEDKALAEAIERHGTVVLAANNDYAETAHARQWMRVNPHERFLRAGASQGFANVELDHDLVIRRVPEGGDVFWREIVRKVNSRQPGLLPDPVLAPGAMIHYAGPDHTYPFVSFYQVLEADTHLPPNVFRDQVILVGRDVKASPEARAANADLFATPFTASTRWLTPGVEIHANVLETALRGDAVVPAPAGYSLALLIAAIGAAAFAMRRWRPIVSLAAGLALAALVAGLTWTLFTQRSMWLPAFGALTGIGATYLVLGALAFLTEQKRRNEVRRAFSLYVSPEVVESMLENPEKLVLGGERRELTILFTDLKGFTTLSEALGPEKIALVVNEHFTRATAIVKRHRGTVTQFIGDAVMAIWGAPLDDPRHAARAAQAAREMQEDLAAMRRDLEARGLPPIFMRVGLHTCNAIVGNLGAADRFNYTAVGDGVNLASRLEGVNKAFGTGILMSEDTVRGLDPGTKLRRVGRVIVKGKTQPVEIFTFEDDARLAAANDAALAAYRGQRWDESERGWREVLAMRAEDGVAGHYLGMIERLRSSPLGADWDGSEAFEKL